MGQKFGVLKNQVILKMFKIIFVKNILNYLHVQLMLLRVVNMADIHYMSIIFCKCIKYWLRLTRMNRDRFPYRCYKILRRLDETGRSTGVIQ